MKLFTIVCAAVLTCAGAFAAAADSITVHFTTPVVIGETVFAAGDVSITVLHGSNNMILSARSESGVAALVVVNRIAGPPEDHARASVVLSRQGNQVKLERVWLDDFTGFAVLPNAD